MPSGLYGTFLGGVDCVSHFGLVLAAWTAVRVPGRETIPSTAPRQFAGSLLKVFLVMRAITISRARRGKAHHRKRPNLLMPGRPWGSSPPFSQAIEECLPWWTRIRSHTAPPRVFGNIRRSSEWNETAGIGK